MTREHTVSITQASDQYREQFLVIYHAGLKHRLNVHPAGDASWVVIDATAYGERRVVSPDATIKQLAPLVSQAFTEYELQAQDLHQRYRPYLRRAASAQE